MSRIWTTIIGVALVVALLLTFLPMQVSVNTNGLLSIRLNQAQANPGIGEFLYKKKLSFNTTAISVTTNQTNFPVCVHINSSSWTNSTERDNFFGAWNVGGKRCQFFDADGTTNLDYEVEFYNSATPEAIYWARAPQVDGNSTADYVWVAFGNDPNGTNQDNKTGVWASTYKFVNHLADYNVETYKSQVYIAVAGEGYYVAEPMVIYRAGLAHPFQMWCAVNYPTAVRIYNYYSDGGSSWTSNGLASPASAYYQPFVLWNPEGDNKYWLYASDTFGDHFDLLTSSSETGFTIDTADVLLKSGDAAKFDETAVYNPIVWYEESDSTANLSTSMNDSTTECDVTDTSKFAATQYIKIESEWMLVTSVVNATHCHVTRARLGTSAVVHTQPQDVYKRQWYMVYDGNTSAAIIRVGLSLSYDGRAWTKQYNGSGAGGSWALPGERHSDAGTIYKVDGVYYHCGHGNWINQGTDGPTDIQGWSYSTDLASWTALGGTGYESFIPRTQAWEGVGVATGQTADLCGLVDNNANPVTVGGYSFFYYTAWMQVGYDAAHPISIGLVKPLGTFSEVVINSPATMADSTGNNVPDQVEYPICATGQVGNGRNWLNGTTKSILRFPDSASHDLGTSFAIGFSVYLDSYLTGPDIVLNKDDAGSNRQLVIALDGAEDNTKKPICYYWDADSHLIYWRADATHDVSTGWHRLVFVRDANTAVYIYIDGAAVANTKTGTLDAAMKSTTAPLYVGYRTYLTNGMDGNLDELRMANAVWTADWAKLDYYSVKKTNFNGDSWLSWGSQEDAPAPAITNTPNSKDFGILEVNTTSNTTLTYFNLTNTGNCAVDISIRSTNMTGGGFIWVLSDTATAGNMTYGLKVGIEGGTFNTTVRLTAPYNNLVEGLGEDVSIRWGFQILAPTSYDDGGEKSGNITLTAIAA